MSEKTNRRLIFISSADDTTLKSTTSNYGQFRINLPSSISPVSLKLLSFTCSNTILNVNSILFGPYAGLLPLIENGSTYLTATVPDGCYNANTLATTMASVMTSASSSSGLGYTYTCTANLTTFTFTWTCSGTFQFNWPIILGGFNSNIYANVPPMYTTAGFRSINEDERILQNYPSSPASTVTSPYFYTLLNPNPIFIRLAPFTSNITTSRGLYANFCITNTTNNGDVLTWNEQMGYKQEIICPNTPVTFELYVEILDQYGNVIPYHSLPVCILLEIEEPIIRR